MNCPDCTEFVLWTAVLEEQEKDDEKEAKTGGRRFPHILRGPNVIGSHLSPIDEDSPINVRDNYA